MNNFIKQVIEEKFASKKQQRFFYAKANEKGSSKKEKGKWSKWAKEFSDKTDFEKLPETSEVEMDEIVDEDGNIMTSSMPISRKAKGITSKSTSDMAQRTGKGMLGSPGIGGVANLNRTLPYLAETDLTKNLGYDDTLGQDEDYEDAKKHFEDNLGMSDDDAEDRLNQMGYDEKLKDTDKVRLIENPKKFMEEYIESILAAKSKENDVLEKDSEVEKEVNPIVVKQINVLKQTLKNNNLTIQDVIKHLKK